MIWMAFFIDPWQPFAAPGMAIEQSSYSIIMPENYTVRYKGYNNAPEPAATNASGSKIFTWEMKNKMPVTREDYGPAWSDIVPRVMFAPSAFEIDNYNGDMSSWQTFGKFFSQLNANRDILPDNIKKDVHTLTDNVPDKKQKIKYFIQLSSAKTAATLL